MKKKLNIPKDFWEDFKDRKDFDEFFGELFQEAINQMLKGEMTDHLGYEKNSKDGDNRGLMILQKESCIILGLISNNHRRSFLADAKLMKKNGYYWSLKVNCSNL